MPSTSTTTPSTDLVPAGQVQLDRWMNEGEIENRIAAIEQRYKAIQRVRQSLMKEDVHYGIIGATGDPEKDKKKKPSLLKPGAEMLCAVFQLVPEITLDRDIEDWDAPEPFFYYRFKCVLKDSNTGRVVGEGFGSCNSKEVKYRYRGGGRVCPSCGEAAIRRSRYAAKNKDWGEVIPWWCSTTNGGCSAEFHPEDPAITGQQAGRQINPDIPEAANTILKMAQKRAYICATLMATMASEFFTQDLEDFDNDDDATTSGRGGAGKHMRPGPGGVPAGAATGGTAQAQQGGQQAARSSRQASGTRRISEAQVKRFYGKAHASGKTASEIEMALNYYGFLNEEGHPDAALITVDKYDALCVWADATTTQSNATGSPAEPQQQQPRTTPASGPQRSNPSASAAPGGPQRSSPAPSAGGRQPSMFPTARGYQG